MSTPEMAAAYPIPGAHSIWELVLHLIATQDALLRRIRGVPAEPQNQGISGFLVPTVSEAAWKETIERLKLQEAELRVAIGNFPASGASE